MDELEISGQRYISSRRAASEHHYHSDYIGQLIRGGKVAGQKVGRTWYVDAASLAAYLKLPTQEPAVVERSETGTADLGQPPPVELPSQRSSDLDARPQSSSGQGVARPFAQEVPPASLVPEPEPQTIQHISILDEPESVRPKQGGLTYLPDIGASLLPEIQRMPALSAQPAQSDESEYRIPIHKAVGRETHAEPPHTKLAFVASPTEERRGRGVARFALAAAVGVLCFSLALGASWALTYDIKVEGAVQTAGIHFSSL